MGDSRDLRPATLASHLGRDPQRFLGAVNTPVFRASTILFPTVADLEQSARGEYEGLSYGLHGVPTVTDLQSAVATIEGAHAAFAVPSGLTATTLPLLALLKPGDHLLVTDSVYGPTRRFCDRTLSRWGCETEYFDTTIGAGIDALIRPTTKLIFLESPGSMTFEIADAPAIAAAAKAKGVVTVMDNTWSGGVFYKPLSLGFDISVQANTKYVSGGADVLSGAIFANSEALFARLKETIADLGVNTSADDAYTVLRGARSLAMRMDRHQASAVEVARWLDAHPSIRRVLHPALESDPGHALWRRDFSGASGLFGIVLKSSETLQVHAFLDALELFGLGFSYGGFESLAIYCDPQLKRNLTKPAYGGPLIRLSIGLEDPADLIADLDQALKALD